MACLVSEILTSDRLVGSNAAALSVEHQDDVLVKILIYVISDLKCVGCAGSSVDVVCSGLVDSGEIASCDLGLGSRVISSLGELALPCDLAGLSVDYEEIFLALFGLCENGLP